MAYKLNVLVAFTGAHYMVFMRVKNDIKDDRVWTLYNDDEPPIKFESYPEVARFLIQSNVVPTMVIYEGFTYKEQNID